MRPGGVIPEFVDTIPEVLADGILYISIRYATVVHLCCCGCDQEVVTPLTPTDWSLTFDGESVSLSPSIGNWSFGCRSHYWIRHNRVEWAPTWSDVRIYRGRARDQQTKSVHFRQRGSGDPAGPKSRLAALFAYLRRVWRRSR